MPPRYQRLALELALLTLLAMGAGYFYVPACWTINALNPGFTGWCVGLAAHLEGGHRLYTDTSHVPLSPLPFVLLHWISPTGKTWMLESVVNFTCITATLLIMHVVLSRLFRPPIAIVASLLSGSLFFTNEITLLYNSLPQVFVALGCLFCLGLSSYPVWQATLLGIATTFCLLTKQTPGIGMTMGVLLFYVIMRSRAESPFRFLVSRVSLYLAVTGATSLLGVWLLSPYLSPAGFVHDVLLTGSQPKGGPVYLVRSFVTLGIDTALGCLFLGFLGVAAYAAASIRTKRGQPDSAHHEKAFLRGLFILVAACAVVAGLYAFLGDSGGAAGRVLQGPVATLVRRLESPGLTLRIGFILLLGAILVKVLPKAWAPRFVQIDAATAGAFAVAVLACLFHSLSVPFMNTWATDQTFQPMVVFCLGVIVYLVMEGCRKLPSLESSPAWPRFVLIGMAACWLAIIPLQRSFLLIDLLRTCHSRWADVPYLAGAKMKDSGEGVHQLVNVVRNIAPVEADVLLLPGDPNLEAMFERKRAPLTCLVVFTDQYWAEYIEEDLRRLRDHPPAVIVAGPRKFMQASPQWAPAAAQLIGRIHTEILPERYTLRASQPVDHMGNQDYFDVYTLNPTANRTVSGM